MTTRRLNEQNDIEFINGTIVTISGIDQIVQEIKTRLKVFQGEWFLDITEGVPYFQTILKKVVNLQEIASILKLRILQTPDVQKLLTFSLDYDKFERRLNVTFSAETVEGIIAELTVNV